MRKFLVLGLMLLFIPSICPAQDASTQINPEYKLQPAQPAIVLDKVSWHTGPDKWTEPRTFHSEFEDEFKQRIIISHGPLDMGLTDKAFSKNKAYWYRFVSPDCTKSGIWEHVIQIYNERDYLINIEVINPRCGHVRPKWINQKLLYVEIWWGRVLGSYLIFDVESEKVITKEMIHDGGNVFQQHQESKHLLRR